MTAPQSTLETEEAAARRNIVTAESLTKRDRALTMTGVLLALLLSGLDQTIVATAGPAIQRDLQIAPGLYAWLTTAYLVAATVMLPIYGKLSDRFGRKPVLLTGVSIFLTGSFICGISPGAMTLIVARGIQGLGAAALFTTAFAVIADLFPPAVRGRYMGLVSAVMGLASVIGPLVGGFITDSFGWHWVFFINLPIGALALWFIITRMPRLGVHLEEKLPVDVAGALLLVVSLVPLMLALSLGRIDPESSGEGFAWGSWQIIGMLAISAIGTVAFVARERRALDPILHLELFRNKVVTLGTAASFVQGGAFLFGIIFLPLYLVNVIGVSATDAGLAMMPLTLGIVVSSITAGQLVSRVGHPKTIILSALGLLAGAFALLAFTLSPESTQMSVTWRMMLMGMGVGPTLPLYTLVMQASSEPREVGVVTATATFSRMLGQVIGLALFGTLFASALSHAVGSRVPVQLAAVQPEVRAAISGSSAPGAVSAEGGVSIAFDTTAAMARVQRVAPGNEQAIAAVRRVHHAFALAFTDAVTLLFKVGIAIVVLGFIITAFMPDVELRHRPEPAPVTFE